MPKVDSHFIKSRSSRKKACAPFHFRKPALNLYLGEDGVQPLKHSTFSDECCYVCHDEFVSSSKICTFPCSHEICISCVGLQLKHLKRKSESVPLKCGMCRSEVPKGFEHGVAEHIGAQNIVRMISGENLRSIFGKDDEITSLVHNLLFHFAFDPLAAEDAIRQVENGSPKPWCGEAAFRQEMEQRVLKELRKRKRNPSVEWEAKLPHMVKRLELLLYERAPSLKHYFSQKTLNSRLRELALELAGMLPVAITVQGDNTETEAEAGTRTGAELDLSRYGHSVNLEEDCFFRDLAEALSARESGSGSGSGQMAQQGTEGARGSDALLPHRQHLLLVLRHASRCSHGGAGAGAGAGAGVCPVSRNCCAARGLWTHVLQCHDSACRFPNCLQARLALCHYSKCTATACAICSPVKRAIRMEATRVGATRMGVTRGQAAQRTGVALLEAAVGGMEVTGVSSSGEGGSLGSALSLPPPSPPPMPPPMPPHVHALE